MAQYLCRSFTKVSSPGMPGDIKRYKEENKINNPFSTVNALFRTNEGGMARMDKSMHTLGHGNGAEIGRVRGTKGSCYEKDEGVGEYIPDLTRSLDHSKSKRIQSFL